MAFVICGVFSQEPDPALWGRTEFSLEDSHRNTVLEDALEDAGTENKLVVF